MKRQHHVRRRGRCDVGLTEPEHARDDLSKSTSTFWWNTGVGLFGVRLALRWGLWTAALTLDHARWSSAVLGSASASGMAHHIATAVVTETSAVKSLMMPSSR